MRLKGDVESDNFSIFLRLLLNRVSVDKLKLRSLRIHGSTFFHAIRLHPRPGFEARVKTLVLRYLNLGREDMSLVGPAFAGASLTFWMNRFDEVDYENFIEPYFEVRFENDDGWWPGCEVLGDGQRTQEKNYGVHM